MELNRKGLLDNLEEPGKGVMPLLRVAEDFYYKKDFDVNSWFAIGHFDVKEHLLNYLFHLMTVRMPDGSTVINSCISITDETTGWHAGEDIVIPLSAAELSEAGFNIKVPNGHMYGDLNRIEVHATMPKGEVLVTMKPIGYPLYNGGTGYFPLLGMNVHQYSIPRLDTTGSITIDGTKWEVQGTSWFDRQWQQMPAGDLAGKWSWMDLNLDNGDAISLWGFVCEKTGTEGAWATILHPDGTQTVTAVEPLSVGASDHWTSAKSGNTYPTRWVVKIPAFDAVLEVTPSPREQEIVSMFPPLNKYEGASAVCGTYRGRETRGYCYVELVGHWR